MKKKILRFIQFITNVHRIHHITYSYGWTFKPIPIGYFDGYKEKDCKENWWALKKIKGFHVIKRKDFHDCTTTGTY